MQFRLLSFPHSLISTINWKHSWQFKDSFLELTGPSRAILIVDPVEFDVELKVKERRESDDQILSFQLFGQNGVFDVKQSVMLVRRFHPIMLGWYSKLKFTYAVLNGAVEATICRVKVVRGSWTKENRGRIVCTTSSIDHEDFVLLDSQDAETMPIGSDDDVIKLSRRVVTVELSGQLTVCVAATQIAGKRSTRDDDGGIAQNEAPSTTDEVYFLDNFRIGTFDMDEDNDKIARINLYDNAMVRKKIGEAKARRKGGKVAFDNFQSESSITQMGSVESQGISAAVQSGGILAAARLGQPSDVQYLQELLLEVQKYVPPPLKNKISAAMRPPVDALYNEHVLSKIGSSDKSKLVLDINNYTIYEHHFVEAFQPKGQLKSSALHAQCSIWNACCHDRIYLQQECVDELVQGGRDKYLSLHLTKEKIKRVKLIFVPVFYSRHCFLVVANFDKNSFDYLDSLKDDSYYECACTVSANLKDHLYKHGINAMTWSLTTMAISLAYDCGYRLMMHMIHYGKDEVFHIVEEMVYRYRMEFAVELLYNPANKVLPTTSRTGGYVNNRHKKFSGDTTRSHQPSLNDDASSSSLSAKSAAEDLQRERMEEQGKRHQLKNLQRK
uniref:Uncharacterized protein n=1 Tax=Oryza punctata TaxID=4537 RepID=A0A0E0KX58_ORYPU